MFTVEQGERIKVYPYDVKDGERIVCRCNNTHDAEIIAQALNLRYAVKDNPNLLNGELDDYKTRWV